MANDNFDEFVAKLQKELDDEALEEYNENLNASLSNGTLLLRHSEIKQLVENGIQAEELLLEYVNELEYRGLKYE